MATPELSFCKCTWLFRYAGWPLPVNIMYSSINSKIWTSAGYNHWISCYLLWYCIDIMAAVCPMFPRCWPRPGSPPAAEAVMMQSDHHHHLLKMRPIAQQGHGLTNPYTGQLYSFSLGRIFMHLCKGSAQSLEQRNRPFDHWSVYLPVPIYYWHCIKDK